MNYRCVLKDYGIPCQEQLYLDVPRQINQSINHPQINNPQINQSINQSINTSSIIINQPFKQLTNHYRHISIKNLNQEYFPIEVNC